MVNAWRKEGRSTRRIHDAEVDPMLGGTRRVKSAPSSRARSPRPRRFTCNSPSPSPSTHPPSPSTHPRTHPAHPHFRPCPFRFEFSTGAQHDLEEDDHLNLAAGDDPVLDLCDLPFPPALLPMKYKTLFQPSWAAGSPPECHLRRTEAQLPPSSRSAFSLQEFSRFHSNYGPAVPDGRTTSGSC